MELSINTQMKATTGSGLLLLHLPSQTLKPNHSLLLFFPKKPQFCASNALSHFLLQPLHLCRSSKWDSNAESFKNQNFSNFEDEEEGFDGDEFLDQGTQVFEEFIDTIWIFKVLRSFGWGLPSILLALVIGGPKAFLMALAVPIGQSTFSFAIQKMIDVMQNKPRHKGKTKKRQRAPTTSKTDFGRKRGSPSTSTGKRKVRYQPWASKNGVSASKDDPKVPSYGGWDELDQVSDSGTDSFESSTQSLVGPSKIPIKKGKLSRPKIKSETPLLLRLLIAIFPFLASWTKLL